MIQRVTAFFIALILAISSWSTNLGQIKSPNVVMKFMNGSPTGWSVNFPPDGPLRLPYSAANFEMRNFQLQLLEPVGKFIDQGNKVGGNYLTFKFFPVGNKLFAAMTGTANFMVINTTNNTIEDALNTGIQPNSVAQVGTNFYMCSYSGIWMVDINGNNLARYLTREACHDMALANNKLYALLREKYIETAPAKIHIIDTKTNVMAETAIATTSGVGQLIALKDKIYFSPTYQEGTFVLDTTTNEVKPSVIALPKYSQFEVVGNKLYIIDGSQKQNPSYISVFDFSTNELVKEKPITFTTSKHIRMAAFGKKLLILSKHKMSDLSAKLEVWNTISGQKIDTNTLEFGLGLPNTMIVVDGKLYLGQGVVWRRPDQETIVSPFMVLDLSNVNYFQ